MIVIQIVALIGIGTMLFSRAATPVGVDYVLFCPVKGTKCLGSSSALTSYAQADQNYYSAKLGSGRTFKIRSIYVKYAAHPNSYYSDGGTTAGASTTMSRVAAELGVTNDANNAYKVNVLMGFQVFHSTWCGASTVPGSLSINDQINPKSYCRPDEMPAMMAHELAHQFGLNHVTDTTNLMYPTVCKSTSGSLSGCNMNGTQTSYLLNNDSAWFPGPAPAPAPAPAPTCSGSNQLAPGQSLTAGQSIVSSNCYRLIFQSDGNLVIYNAAGTAIWNTATYNRGGTVAVFQSDGNFVIYAGGTALWNTQTSGHGGTVLVMQTDGNLVIYAGGTPLWSSKGGRTY